MHFTQRTHNNAHAINLFIQINKQEALTHINYLELIKTINVNYISNVCSPFLGS